MQGIKLKHVVFEYFEVFANFKKCILFSALVELDEKRVVESYSKGVL